jgi:hypothetical protein
LDLSIFLGIDQRDVPFRPMPTIRPFYSISEARDQSWTTSHRYNFFLIKGITNPYGFVIIRNMQHFKLLSELTPPKIYKQSFKFGFYLYIHLCTIRLHTNTILIICRICHFHFTNWTSFALTCLLFLPFALFMPNLGIPRALFYTFNAWHNKIFGDFAWSGYI